MDKNARRPIITKRQPPHSSNIKKEGPKKEKPNQRQTPYRKAPLPASMAPEEEQLLAAESDGVQIDLLDRPRTHNPAKDMPKVKYQSIILEEPIEIEDVGYSKKPSSYGPTKPLKDDSDKNNSPRSSSVNYGYHPIIDFFPRYRFDASAH